MWNQFATKSWKDILTLSEKEKKNHRLLKFASKPKAHRCTQLRLFLFQICMASQTFLFFCCSISSLLHKFREMSWYSLHTMGWGEHLTDVVTFNAWHWYLVLFLNIKFEGTKMRLLQTLAVHGCSGLYLNITCS